MQRFWESPMYDSHAQEVL